jgi:hypothetical protein
MFKIVHTGEKRVFVVFLIVTIWWKENTGDGIFKLLRSPGIDSKESIPPAYMKPGGPVRQIGFSYRSARLGIDSWAP